MTDGPWTDVTWNPEADTFTLRLTIAPQPTEGLPIATFTRDELVALRDRMDDILATAPVRLTGPVAPDAYKLLTARSLFEARIRWAAGFDCHSAPAAKYELFEVLTTPNRRINRPFQIDAVRQINRMIASDFRREGDGEPAAPGGD